MRFIRSRPQFVVGLEIKTHEVRLILVSQTKKMRVIEQMEVIDLPLGAIKAGRIQMLDQVTERLHRVVQHLKIKNMPAVVGLPMQSVMNKRIQFEKKLSQEKQEKWIEENISHCFPTVTEDLCYDYVVLSTMDVVHDTALLIAMPLDQIHDYIRVIERAGLCIKIMDVDQYALIRALKIGITREVSSSFAALLDIDSDTTHFTLFNLNEILFYQQWEGLHRQKLMDAIQWACSAYSVMKPDHFYFINKKEHDLSVIDELQEQLGIRIQWVDLQQSVIFSPSIAIEKRLSFSSKMMVSFGLALRKIPSW